MKVFYPASTEKIMHKSKSGEVYRLDSFENPLNLYKRLKLMKSFKINSVSVTGKGNLAAEYLISTIHTKKLLNAYKTGKNIERYNKSGIFYQGHFYNFVSESALCSNYVATEALSSGRSFSLTGGGHHAEKDKGLGFCPINTIAIAALSAVDLGTKVAIIDLDIHYGNGIFDILKDNESIFCTSIWGKKIDKWRYYESQNNIWHRRVENRTEYFTELGKLFETIDCWKPELIIYHLGLDVLQTDRMGGIKGFCEQDLYRREDLVKNFVNKSGYKLSIFRGGAYVDYTLSPKNIKKQKEKITQMQIDILNNYN